MKKILIILGTLVCINFLIIAISKAFAATTHVSLNNNSTIENIEK